MIEWPEEIKAKAARALRIELCQGDGVECSWDDCSHAVLVAIEDDVVSRSVVEEHELRADLLRGQIAAMEAEVLDVDADLVTRTRERDEVLRVARDLADALREIADQEPTFKPGWRHWRTIAQEAVAAFDALPTERNE